MSLSSKLYASLGPQSYAQTLQDSVLSPPSGSGLALGGFTLANRSGSAVDVGLCWRLPNAYWTAGYLTAASTPDFSNAKTLAQSTTANAFVNAFTTTNNDGFIIQSVEKFNGITFRLDDNGATSTLAITYYDGTNMTTLPTIATPNLAAANATYQTLLFAAPPDWVVNSTAAVGGDTSKFSIAIRASTAPASVVSISDVRVFKLIDFYPQLASNSEVISSMNGNELQLPVGASIAPYFGGTASNTNQVWLDYRVLSRQV